MERQRDQLFALLNRQIEGIASPEEEAEIVCLLKKTPALQEDYLLFLELHCMLSDEPAIREALPNLPENVISLSGTTAGQNTVNQDEDTCPIADLPSLSSGRKPSLFAMLAIAAVVIFSCLVWYFQPHKQSGQNPDKSVVETPTLPHQATHRTPVKKANLPPEEQYQRAILASVSSTGSQKRPPTSFTSDREPVASGKVSFNRDIRPILSDNCYACHGPDGKSRKAKLRLDTEEGATGGKEAPIVRGSAAKSELITRLRTSDPDEIMPPPDSHKSLTPRQIELIALWIDQGADWEAHWSFMPVVNHLPNDLSKAVNPIDYFVDEKLKENGLARSPEADRYTLARRLALDLTGLPLSPNRVESFVADSSPDAFAKLVDELLALPSFGEHRARYWLDAARYGDTHGLHLDNYREIWPYRDWVINAFNHNMPFDQFTIQQLAGDLLPNATQSQRIATGFNRCNVTTAEGGAIEEEFLVRYAVDRVSTTATVWLGLTAGCSQCHDHKFDPITMRDFYQMFAYFNNTTQPGLDGNTKDSPPSMRVFNSPETEKRVKELQAAISDEKKKLAEAKKQTQADPEFQASTPKSVAPKLINHGEAEVATNLGKEGAVSVNQPFTVSFRYRIPDGEDASVTLVQKIDTKNHNRGWRVLVEDQGMVLQLIESWPDKTLKRGLTRRFKPGSRGHIAISYDGSGRSDGVELYLNGDLQNSRFVNQWHDSLEKDFRSDDAPLLIGGKDPVTGKSPGVDEFALFNRRLTDEEIKNLSNWSSLAGIEKKPAEKRNAKDQEMREQFQLNFFSGPYSKQLAKVGELETSLNQIISKTPLTLVMAEKPDTPAKAHILSRGEYDQPGEEVSAELPSFLPHKEGEFAPNRLGLAQALMDRRNPLTARVTVNRIWQELFGTGLVKTAEDFGTQGENPSHPELLDWLAWHFMETGWDVKSLYRTIVLSQTYRQSSQVTPELLEKDRENRLLARGPRFRMDAEMIRDQALMASGLLDTEVGGPSVKPYQPSGIWKAVGYTNSNTQTFSQDFGKTGEHRRSLYSFWKRTAPPPNMAILDAPNRESCIVRRERTNTPLQALVLMNDPQFMRAARFLAQRSVHESEGPQPKSRANHMSMLLLNRPLSDDETTVIVNSFDQFRNAYASNTPAAGKLLQDEINPGFSLIPEKAGDAGTVELASWSMVASQFLNLDESLNKN